MDKELKSVWKLDSYNQRLLYVGITLVLPGEINDDEKIIYREIKDNKPMECNGIIPLIQNDLEK